jgi:hypothetical protein
MKSRKSAKPQSWESRRAREREQRNRSHREGCRAGAHAPKSADDGLRTIEGSRDPSPKRPLNFVLSALAPVFFLRPSGDSVISILALGNHASQTIRPLVSNVLSVPLGFCV